MNHFSAKNSLITGTFLLTCAGILSRIIGFFYKIFLSRTIGAQGLGIYQLIFPVMGLCISFTCSGIQTAISRFVSKEIGNNNPSGARLYLIVGLFLSIILSFITGIFMQNYADYIAAFFLKEPQCAPLLKILSLCCLPCSIHSCINGYYYGLKKTLIPSLSQLLEQLVRVGSVYLFYVIAQSQGRTLTINSAVWGLVLGEAFGMFFSLSTIGIHSCSGNIKQTTFSLLKMAVPLTANRLILNLFSSIENLLIPDRLKSFGYTSAEALSIYGILTGMALSVILFPTVLTNSFSVLLLPSISQAQAKNDDRLIKKTIFQTTEICLLLGLFCTIALLFTGKFIGNVIFQNALSGTFILTLSWICPFLYLSSTLNSIFHGLGKPSITLALNVCACLLRIFFIWFLIPIIGIRGYLIGLLASHIAVCIFSLILLCRFMKKN